MIRRIGWEEMGSGRDGVLTALAAGEIAEIVRGGEVVAVLASPAGAGMRSLKVSRARRRGGFELLAGARPSHPTAELLGRLRERR